MRYKIIKQGLNLKGSEIGDIVEMNDKAADVALKAGVVEIYEGELKAKHVFLFVDALRSTGRALKVNQA